MARSSGGNLAAESGLVFLFDPLYKVSESLWYDSLSNTSGSFSASSQTGSFFYVDSQSFTINSTNSMNPYKDDYTYSFWIKPWQRDVVLIDRDRQFRLFLTNTNQIQCSLFPTNNYFGLLDIYASGSYLYALNNGGNNNFQFLRYNTSDLKLDFARWQEGSGLDGISGNYPVSLTSYGDMIIIGWLNGVTEFTGSLFSSRTTGTTMGSVTYGIGVPQTYISYIRGIASDGTSYYFTDETNHRVQQRSRPGFTYVTHSGTGGGTGVLQYSSPKGLYIDTDYVYVSDYGNHRIKKLNIADLTNVLITGSQGDGTGQFRGPYGITGDDTYLYIAEYGGHRITKLLKSDLSYVARTGSNTLHQTASHYFNQPTYISLWGDDLFVVSFYDKVIKKFSAADFSYKNAKISGSDNLREAGQMYGIKTSQINDNYIHTVDAGRDYKSYQPISGNLIISRSIMYDVSASDIYAMLKSGSYFYVANTTGNKITLYDSTWTAVTQSGLGLPVGTGIYDYNNPYGICYDDDYVYVTDRGNNRIKKLNKSDLTYVTLSAAFGTPYGITHSSGTLYIVAQSNAGGFYGQRFYIVSASDLSIDGYVTTSSPYYNIGIDNDYFYGYDSTGYYGISKYSKIKPWPRVARYDMPYGDDINQRYTFYDLGIDNEYIYIANGYSMVIHDKETLGFVNKVSWNEFNFVSKRLDYNPTGSWLNVVLTLGQTSASLYLNGEFHVSQSWTGSLDITKRNDFSSNAPFRFGVNNKTGLYATESIGMISGYNRILTDDEIQKNYITMKNARFYK